MLHIALDGTDEDIAGHHAVFGCETVGKIIGIEDLCIGRELIIAFPDQNPHLVATHQLEFKAGITVLDGNCAHLLRSGAESGNAEAKGKGSAGQDAAGVGLDVHFAPGHFAESLPLTAPSRIPALQQIAQQEGLGGQGRQGTAVQSPDSVIRVGNGKFPAEEIYIKFFSVPFDTAQSLCCIGRIQLLEQLLIVGKGDFFLVIFDLHSLSSLFV